MEKEQDFLISKTFIFESQNSFSSENLEILLRQDLEFIDIGEIINIFRQKNAMHQPLEFKIFDTTLNQFFPLDPTKRISKTYGYSPVIMIKYKIIDTISEVKANNKRERNKQRSIRQVLQYVKKWRDIHNTKGKNKLNLQESAKILGISKKSLDDYFCQLRLAQQYGFDFHSSLQQKIGVLRAFVKKVRPKGDVGAPKHQKLPKKLRIIQQLGQILQIKDFNPKTIKSQMQQIMSSNQSQAILDLIPEQIQDNNGLYNSFPTRDNDDTGFKETL